jgi:glucose-1-phosphate cytidylyltransferase
MKAVILAGGLGTRFAEETDVKPKPMIEVGGMPIIWNVMKIYSAHDISDFVICLGYKGTSPKNTSITTSLTRTTSFICLT